MQDTRLTNYVRIRFRARRLAELVVKVIDGEGAAADWLDEAEAVAEKLLRLINEAREERQKAMAEVGSPMG
jgi:hypothetical protein